MRFLTPHRITAHLIAASVVIIAGCAPYAGNGYQPIGYGPGPYYPGTPNGGYPNGGTVPVNYPGGNPPIIWGPGTPTPTPNNPVPNTPQPPDKPVVLEPVPQKPTDPGPNVPVNYPVPTSPNSPEVNAKWAPWPLPPRAAAKLASPKSENEVATAQSQGLPHTAAYEPQSEAAEKYNAAAVDGGTVEGQTPGSEGRVDGANPSPAQDLRYRGGKTLQNISYVNLYVGGEAAGWKLDEVAKIEAGIEAALTDQNLNNVIIQYFDNQPIGTNARPCHPLIGYKPSVVSRGDIQHYIEFLVDQNYLRSYDLNTTIFNFLLPPGTILNDEDQPENAVYNGADRLDKPVVESDEAGDSTGGLGGYHGSVHHNNVTLYYSVEVYSENRSDGFRNGIPVFAEPWKNICATLYHEICEFRTDPDVEDAIRDPYNPASEKFLGWTSDAGEEIGDYPLHAGVSLRDVVTEVPLTNGQGTVPVQLNYSNAVDGPEGPIPAPHPPAVR